MKGGEDGVSHGDRYKGAGMSSGDVTNDKRERAIEDAVLYVEG